MLSHFAEQIQVDLCDHKFWLIMTAFFYNAARRELTVGRSQENRLSIDGIYGWLALQAADHGGLDYINVILDTSRPGADPYSGKALEIIRPGRHKDYLSIFVSGGSGNLGEFDVVAYIYA